MNRRNLLIGGTAALVLAGAGGVAWRQSVGSMRAYADYARRLRAKPTPSPDIGELIRYAALAANGHNTQPWRFGIEDGGIALFPDEARRTPVVDPDDHHLFVSLGCAVETLAIAAQATGRPGEVVVEPGDGSAVRFDFSAGPARADPLFDAIPLRQSTRVDYDGRAVPPADLAALERAAAEPGVRMILVTERSRMNQLRDLVVAGNDAQMTDPAFMAELKHWLRFNPRSAIASGDGLFSACTGNPVLPAFLGGPAFDIFLTARTENDRYARQIDSSAGLAIFVADRADTGHWIRVGRACQRFALTATSLGLKHAFVNQPVEVARLRPELAERVGEAGKRPNIVMRFGYGPLMPFSPRRPAEAVIA
ncbi:nitroreductase family protein [Rhizobiaceae bacterium BDR2-2]|uniref:Nitroreductase family protein n=1 Tax=Ectorhizobium quercum TaxID=2965071 RepID=A0AAE3N1A1_9HYPH|nr:nitroreductase family protein [Ectorhizobium quercum]MCX8997455.1 nitroreductase family protein [Ectorhizobium quercum]